MIFINRQAKCQQGVIWPTAYADGELVDSLTRINRAATRERRSALKPDSRYIRDAFPSLPPPRMRRALFALLLLGTVAAPARAQSQLHEYRPEAIITLPRVNGVGVTLLLDERLATKDLAPTEVMLGVGLISPQFYHRTSVALEVRRVRTLDGPLEHRYIPTLYTNFSLPAGFELRNRTRYEMRYVNRVWSQRYINRFTLGHDVIADARTVFPYAQFDLAYDTRFDKVTRRDASVGVRVPLGRIASIDPFMTRTSDASRTPLLGLMAGAVLRLAL